MYDNFSNKKNTHSRVIADTYKNTEWPVEYFKEFQESNKMRWEPFVYWRREEYKGKFINVNKNGMRTISRDEIETEKSKRKVKIFMFGGSTIWGTGARDNNTIPALLERSIEAITDTTIEMHNFGESGYVSSQELVALMRQLQKDNIPDIAIFYDGVNDMFSAFQQGKPGLPQNEFNRVKEFNILHDSNFIRGKAVVDLVNSLSTTRFIKHFKKEIKINKFKADAKGDYVLFNDVINTYSNNIKMVDALAKKYGFDYVFYWQPTIYQKNILTHYEKNESKKYKWLSDIYNSAYEQPIYQLDGFSDKYNFINISKLFSNIEEPLFIDFCHLGADGNRRIADRMLTDISPMVKSKSSARTKRESAAYR